MTELAALLLSKYMQLRRRRAFLSSLIVYAATLVSEEVTLSDLKLLNQSKSAKKRNRVWGLHRPTSGGVMHRYQPKRGTRNIQEFNIQRETSLTVAQFEEVYERISIGFTARTGGKPIKTVLSRRTRLLLVLHWLREKPKMRILAQKFGVSIATGMFQQLFIDLFSLSRCTLLLTQVGCCN